MIHGHTPRNRTQCRREPRAKFRALLIEKVKSTIAKRGHDKFRQFAERGAILLDQPELSFSDLQEDAS